MISTRNKRETQDEELILAKLKDNIPAAPVKVCISDGNIRQDGEIWIHFDGGATCAECICKVKYLCWIQVPYSQKKYIM